MTVDFQGIVDETEGSDWRVTLVATDDKGRSRYSETVHGGKLSFDILPSDKALTLAVAATPTVYKPQEFRPGYGKKPRFPYEVSFTGATPATTPPQMPEMKSEGHRHPNGGGFVGASATVADSAYVGPDARVVGNARVTDQARIEGNAVISQEATVCGNAVIAGFARVMDRAVVKDDTRVRDCAVVRSEGQVADAAELTIDAWLKWSGGSERQTAFAFGSAGGEISLSPSNDQGKATLVVKAGNRQFSLVAATPLPKGKWVRTTVILGKQEAKLLVDGKVVARLKQPTLTPADVPVSVGYLGRRLDPSGFYVGLIGDVAVYRRAMPER